VGSQSRAHAPDGHFAQCGCVGSLASSAGGKELMGMRGSMEPRRLWPSGLIRRVTLTVP